MNPSDSFRARRPPSPHRLALTHPPPPPQPRFPQHRSGEYVGADEKLDAVRQDAAGRPVLTRKSHAGALRKMTPGEWKLLIAIALIASAVRLFRLSKPNSVVFDEVHFGKFAGKYIKTRYYVDVHPPLAKLLLTFAAFVGGFDGNFDFKDIGKIYENVPYIMMRMLPATLGVALVPITYLTLRALECSTSTAIMGAIFVTFENGLVTQSRLILLDSPLLFFTGLSTFFWISFCNEDKRKPFTDIWWIWLVLTGFALGAVVSCKWVGLFTIATVGFSTIKQLWALLGDLNVNAKTWLRHFIARALCLILIPILFYMAMFEIHFAILQNSGDGDGFMSSEFQHTLGGRGMLDTYSDIAIGSTITIRHLNTQGGFLHSHAHNYPGGSNQQQITLYPHRDNNNNWKILNVTSGDPAKAPDWEHKLAHVTDGMVIRLEHIGTEKRLHSHDHRPPVSEVDFQNEVSGYGFPGFEGDANDNFIVEIAYGDKHDRESAKRLKTLRTKFRLRHQFTGCYLFSHKVKLPEWGFEQQEVTCNKNAVRPNSLWFVETNTHPMLPENAPKVNYKLPGFFAKFLELQVVMWRTNAGLTDRHSYDSRPHQWPGLRRGINFWVKEHRQIYLIGNPFVWWSSTAAVVTYLVVRGLLILRAQRGYKDFHHTAVVKYDNLIGFLVMGWALHYFPFFVMQRQLFLHHYFPALYFSILTACAVFDLVTSTLGPRRRIQIAAFFMVIAVWNYAHFSPLAYGNPWTREQCRNAQWLKTWDFSCNDFLENMSQYKTIATTPAGAPTVTKAVPAAANAEPNKPGNPAKAEHTTEMVKERIEPGRDIFANPVQDDHVNPETTASVDPAVLEAKKKAMEEKMRAEMEKLKNQVGPLRASDFIVQDAIEQASLDALVKGLSEAYAKPKEDGRKAENTAPLREGTEEKTVEKTVEKTEEKVTEPQREEKDEKGEKGESIPSIQPAPAPSPTQEEEEENPKKTPSLEEIEAERVRQSMWRKEDD